MKKTYIQPEVEITLPLLETAILGVSLNIDDKNQGSGDAEDDEEGIEGDVNWFNHWEEFS
ncbi:MAG: hypothetical protein IJM04_03180 [Prevotella sp.]|nr:hypothetical protein [Prevotella sp.]